MTEDFDLDLQQEELIDKVIDQIIIDIENGDYTALFELLSNLSDRDLKAYLPEGE